MRLGYFIKSVALLFIMILLAGCYAYAPTTFHVMDAHTKSPINGASVNVAYETYLNFFPPQLVKGTTSQNGEVTLPVDLHVAIVKFEVKASDYLPYDANLTADGRIWRSSSDIVDRTATAFGKEIAPKKPKEIVVLLEKKTE